MPVNPMSAVIDRAVSVGVHEDALPPSTRERYPAARIGRGFEKGRLLTDDSAVAMRELTDDFARH